jgi:trimethylamine---corrinoid protein Co-methyltransferase
MPSPTLTLWGEDECRSLHDATMTVLAETGVEILQDERSLSLFRELGAHVEGTRVRLDSGLVAAALATAPREWTLKPRGGDTAPLVLREGNTFFGTGSDCLYVRDPDTSRRRRARIADVEGMAALCEKLPHIDFVMTMGSPEDVRWEVDDLAHLAAMLKGTRKPLLLTPINGKRLPRLQQMAALCGERDSFAVYAMPSPPLQHDAEALSKVIACSDLQIPLIYAPAPCAGTTSPRSITATVLVANAEVLSGLVLHQHVRPGAPFVYGAGGGAMDMRGMTNDPYTVPEACLALQACCDLARFYGLPSFSYAGHSVAKTLDEQWSADAALTTMLGALSRATLLHDVGYLEDGMQSSYESIVLGNELVGYARAFLREVLLDEHALALEEIAVAGPGGHHLGTRYTRDHYREFWTSDLFDNSGYDRWSAAGERSLRDRVRAQVERLRREERDFIPTAAQRKELDALVAAELASPADGS